MKAFFAVLFVVALSVLTWYCVDDDAPIDPVKEVYNGSFNEAE